MARVMISKRLPDFFSKGSLVPSERPKEKANGHKVFRMCNKRINSNMELLFVRCLGVSEYEKEIF